MTLTTEQILDAFAHVDFLEAELALATTDEDRDVIDIDINAWLSDLGAATADKLDALAFVIDRANAEAKLAKVHEDRAADRRRRAAAAKARCTALAHRLMAEAAEQGLAARTRSGTPYIDTGRVRVTLAKTPPALSAPLDIEQWPARWRVSQPDRPDRRAALKAIKAGEAVDGFTTTTSTSVRFK